MVYPFFLLTLNFGFCPNAYNQSFLSEKQLQATFLEFNSSKKQYSFLNLRNQTINWTYLSTNPKNLNSSLGTIVISPGRTESSLNWSELSVAFKNAGYAVAIIDHISQGQSDRIVQDKDIGHIDHFESYSDDFNLFLSNVKNKTKGPFYLIGNSMGAPIALISDTSMFKKIVLHAPMFKIKTGFIPYGIARILSDVLVWFNKSVDYAPMTGAFVPALFTENLFASSKARYEFDLLQLKNNPHAVVGGPSVKWVNEAFRVPELMSLHLKNIIAPVMIFQAEQEYFVDNSLQIEICNSLANCKLEQLKQSMHVLHLETDQNINRLFTKTIQFFKK